MTDKDIITLPREVVVQTVRVLSKFYDTWPRERKEAVAALRTHLVAEQPKPSEDIEALRRDAYQGGWLREWLDSNGLLARAIRGESLAGYEHPDIKALRRDAERLKDAMRKAMAMLDKHEPEPAGAFAVLLLALNPELQSAKNAALRREET